MFLKIISGFVIGYLIFVSILYVVQRRMVYLPSYGVPHPKAFRADDMQVVSFQTSDGLRLNAWYKPATRNKPTIVYFHGNGGHVGLRIPLIRPYLDNGYGVLLVSYRGYAGNPGWPSEQGLYRDGRASIRFLFEEEKVSPRCLIIFGESLGSGVAVQMATEYQAASALILESPYTTLPELASHHYPYLPVHWMLKDRFNSYEKIKNIRIPVLVVHGEKDKVVPVEFGKKLFTVINDPKQAHYFENAGHEDLPIEELTSTVINFVDRYVDCVQQA